MQLINVCKGYHRPPPNPQNEVCPVELEDLTDPAAAPEDGADGLRCRIVVGHFEYRDYEPRAPRVYRMAIGSMTNGSRTW